MSPCVPLRTPELSVFLNVDYMKHAWKQNNTLHKLMFFFHVLTSKVGKSQWQNSMVQLFSFKYGGFQPLPRKLSYINPFPKYIDQNIDVFLGINYLIDKLRKLSFDLFSKYVRKVVTILLWDQLCAQETLFFLPMIVNLNKEQNKLKKSHEVLFTS